MRLFDAVNPFDSRYYGANEDFYNLVGPYLSEQSQIKYQIRVEAALLEGLRDLGLIGSSDLPDLSKLADSIPPSEVYEEEKITQHNVRALVNCIKRRLPAKSAAFVHLTATSCDITDTARSLCFKEFTRNVLLLKALDLLEMLIGLARKYASEAQIGRTHGQHAIPTTFGHAMALYASRIGKRIERILEASDLLPGKVSGAVGTYAAQSIVFPDDPKSLEKHVLQKLGLSIPQSNIASQIVEPEPLADLCHFSVSLLGVLANLSDDFRHLMRSEIAEIGKTVGAGHVGSSTMPHKVNPVDFENVKSIWKEYMPRMTTVMLDQISEHQRDLTNSASGRYVPELLGAVTYAITRVCKALERTVLNKESLCRNLDAAKDSFIAEPLYIVFSSNGVNDGYEIVRDAARQARESGKPLSAVLSSDPRLVRVISSLPQASAAKIKAILARPEEYLGLARDCALEIADFWESKAKALREKSRT